MKTRNTLLGALYVIFYSFLVLLPIIILLLGPTNPTRPTLFEISVSFAFIGLSMVSLQFISSARFKFLNQPFGTDLVYHFHRQMGIASSFLILAHPILLFIVDPRLIEATNNAQSALQIELGEFALFLLIVVVWASELRKRLKIPYQFWKLWHGILATVMVAIALAHIFIGGTYTNTPVKQAVWIGYSVLLTLTLIYTRVIYPLQLMRKPYQVKEVKQERGSVWTIKMEPIGHPGFNFQPGQFGWLTAWRTPFSDTEHPFSLVSSAENRSFVEMSIKKLGQFTARIQTLKPGEKVFLDGPYGNFSIDRYPNAKKLVLVPGGIGITPIMSTLRTMADRGDQRPVKLFYCNILWDDVTFREEVAELEQKLNIQVIYTIEKPPEKWQGESGFLNTAILTKYMDETWIREGTEVFLCGPAPMMAAVEKALLNAGFDQRQVHSERFALA